jgi:hypothetical protein
MRDKVDNLMGRVLLHTETPVEVRAGLHLWKASENYAKTTGGDEFSFADAALRLYAGAFAKLDRNAARDYLATLVDRNDPGLTANQRLEADGRRIHAWERLRAALALAAQPAEGRG